MTTYLYNELGADKPLEITDKKILEIYWGVWSQRMREKYGDLSPLITETNCIQDWVVVNWAWKK